MSVIAGYMATLACVLATFTIPVQRQQAGRPASPRTRLHPPGRHRWRRQPQSFLLLPQGPTCRRGYRRRKPAFNVMQGIHESRHVQQNRAQHVSSALVLIMNEVACFRRSSVLELSILYVCMFARACVCVYRQRSGAH